VGRRIPIHHLPEKLSNGMGWPMLLLTGQNQEVGQRPP